MTATEFAQIQLRAATAAAWTTANPTLGPNEPGWEKDTKRLKFGDGVTAWNALPYFTASDPEVIRDTIAAALVGGSNVTITPNDGADTITIAAAGGVGALTRAAVGRDVIGASLEVMTNNRIYLKKITLAADCLITNIESYLDAQSNVWAVAAALYADNAGAPGKLRAAGAHPAAGLYPSDAGWFGVPLGQWATAGDWWIAVQFRGSSTTSPFQIAYDTGGSDLYNTAAGAWLPEMTGAATTNSTRNYSIRANTIK